MLGAALVAAALVLLVSAALKPGDRDAGPRAAPAGDPAAVTNGVIAFWEARLAGDPLDFTAANRLAASYLQRARETGDVSDYSRAEAAVNASLGALPADNQLALALLSSIKATQHDFAAAEETARRAIALDPGDPYAYGVLGDAQVALGLYDDADRTYAGLVAMSPGLSSFSRQAYLLELNGDIAGAEVAWENAFSTDAGRRPENTAWARVQFGTFYFNRGDLDAAEEQYGLALRAYPSFVHATAGLAKVAAARGDFDQAAALYEAVVRRQPVPEYVAALGDVYAVAGRPSDAQAQYDLVLAIDGLYRANGINTDLTLALFFADHDIRIDDAVRQARSVYKAQPSIQAAGVLAWSLFKAGEFEDAARYIGEALRLDTLDAAMHFHAGMIYRAIGDTNSARAHFEMSLQINPDFSVLYAGQAAQALQDPQASR